MIPDPTPTNPLPAQHRSSNTLANTIFFLNAISLATFLILLYWLTVWACSILPLLIMYHMNPRPITDLLLPPVHRPAYTLKSRRMVKLRSASPDTFTVFSVQTQIQGLDDKDSAVTTTIVGSKYPLLLNDVDGYSACQYFPPYSESLC